METYRLAKWKVLGLEELEPYTGYRWIVTFVGFPEPTSPSEASGEGFEVRGRGNLLSDLRRLRTRAGEEDFRGLYDQLGTPPKPGVFWKGDIGDMGFGAAVWTTSMRFHEGEYRPENGQSGTPLVPAPDQLGSIRQWSKPGKYHIKGKGDYGYKNDKKSDPYEGMPASIHFKFEMSPIGSFTERTYLQIHPDGFSDGTFGCVGIQSYDDCCKFLYLARQYFQTRILVK